MPMPRARRSTSGTAPPTAIRRCSRTPTASTLDRRNASRHVAFAAGEHRCPGEGLTKLEQRIAVEHFIARMGELRFTPGRNDFEHLRGFWLRALRELHVSFEPLPT